MNAAHVFPLTRRHFVGSAGALAGSVILGVPGWAEAATKLTVNVVGFTLGIHIPLHATLGEGLAAETGQEAPDVVRIDKLPVITQSVMSGASQIGDGDIVTTLRAIEAGASLKIIGLSYNSTSLVYVGNGKTVRSLEDLAQPGKVVAVNSSGDFTYLTLVGPLRDKGIALDKLTVIDIGGSGNRVRALMAGKVDAVPMHIDQAMELASQGDYPIILKPWEVYKAWFGEVLFCDERWLAAPENRETAVAFIRAQLKSFRRANDDFGWYADMFRKYTTAPNGKSMGDDQIKAGWEILSRDVKAWPGSMETLTVENFENLLPVFKETGALNGTIDMSKALDLSILEEAKKGL